VRRIREVHITFALFGPKATRDVVVLHYNLELNCIYGNTLGLDNRHIIKRQQLSNINAHFQFSLT